MEFEDWQRVWKSQKPGAILSSTDFLITEVRRNQQYFTGIIFRRDVREVAICLLTAGIFLAWGWSWHWWSLYLLSFCCFVVGSSFLVDRRIQRRKQPVRNDSLKSYVESSLFQVKHQIWLLRNILWWYLLPVVIGLAAVAGQTIWSHRAEGLGAMLRLASIYAVTYGITYGVLYWANQRAVRKELEPRRRELEELLEVLNPGS